MDIEKILELIAKKYPDKNEDSYVELRLFRDGSGGEIVETFPFEREPRKIRHFGFFSLDALVAHLAEGVGEIEQNGDGALCINCDG